MSLARDDEFVVSPEMAELAERQGVPLHAGERVRFTVLDSGVAERSGAPVSTWPPAWVGSIKGAEPDLATNFRQTMRDEIAGR